MRILVISTIMQSFAFIKPTPFSYVYHIKKCQGLVSPSAPGRVITLSRPAAPSHLCVYNCDIPPSDGYNYRRVFITFITNGENHTTTEFLPISYHIQCYIISLLAQEISYNLSHINAPYVMKRRQE